MARKKVQQQGNLKSELSVPLDEADEINNDLVGDETEPDETVFKPKPYGEEVVMMVSDTEVTFTIQNN